MDEFLMALWPYVPFVIFAAAFLDTLCFTGLFFYGGAMVGAVLAFYVGGVVTIPEIIVAATAGTLLGSGTNFYLGYYSSHTKRVQAFLAHNKAKRVTEFIGRNHLLTVLVIGRIITIARPFYSLILGVTKVSPRRFFLYEIPIIIVWVLVWLFILLQGERLLSYFLSH